MGVSWLSLSVTFDQPSSPGSSQNHRKHTRHPPRRQVSAKQSDHAHQESDDGEDGQTAVQYLPPAAYSHSLGASLHPPTLGPAQEDGSRGACFPGWRTYGYGVVVSRIDLEWPREWREPPEALRAEAAAHPGLSS